MRSSGPKDVSDSLAVRPVPDAATEEGADVIQWAWWGGDNQRWEFEFLETVDPTDDGRPW